MQQLPNALLPLADYDQFLIYKLAWLPQKGKYNKIPLNCDTLKGADPTDPNQWVPAHYAIAKANELGDGYGVAFCFSESDPFWFLDIDNAYINNDWSPIAKELCTLLAGAAIEVSQSGTGLHIFGSGTVPDHGCTDKAHGLEFYHKDRFVALTGINAVGDPRTDHTQAIAHLVTKHFDPSLSGKDAQWSDKPRDDWDGFTDDDELINKALASKSAASAFGGKASFADLWYGNEEVLITCYPETDPTKKWDYSAADIALCNHLAFWTGCDCERMLRLMWKSGLVRDKWTQHKDLLRINIKSAVAAQGEVYNRGKFTKDQTIVAPVAGEFEGVLERIEMEGADPIKARELVDIIRDTQWSILDKEIAATKLFDVMKTAGLDVRKTTIVGNCTKGTQQVVQQPTSIGFVDVKHTGKPKATKENLQILLNHYGITCRYNLMSKEVEINIPGKVYTVDNAINCATADVGSLCARHELPKGEVMDYLTIIADENSYNPVYGWLSSLQWDGQDRLQELTQSLDPEDFNLAYWLVRRWLISAVAAACNPNGIAAAGMLVLQGDQYIGKSRWFWSLLADRRWGKESAILNPHDKDSVKLCVSRWIVELGELDATFKKADIAALKGFITLGEDELRLPYARGVSKYPRRTVYFGSVNPREFLHDDTGNRRFWTVACGKKLNAEHGLDVNQIWAQVAQLYLNDKEQHWLTKDENDALNAYNLGFEAVSPIEDLLLQFYDMTDNVRKPRTATQILEELGFERPTKGQSREVNIAIFKLFGLTWRKSDGKRVYDLPLPKTKASEVFKNVQV